MRLIWVKRICAQLTLLLRFRQARQAAAPTLFLFVTESCGGVLLEPDWLSSCPGSLGRKGRSIMCRAISSHAPHLALAWLKLQPTDYNETETRGERAARLAVTFLLADSKLHGCKKEDRKCLSRTQAQQRH